MLADVDCDTWERRALLWLQRSRCIRTDHRAWFHVSNICMLAGNRLLIRKEKSVFHMYLHRSVSMRMARCVLLGLYVFILMHRFHMFP